MGNANNQQHKNIERKRSNQRNYFTKNIQVAVVTKLVDIQLWSFSRSSDSQENSGLRVHKFAYRGHFEHTGAVLEGLLVRTNVLDGPLGGRLEH